MPHATSPQDNQDDQDDQDDTLIQQVLNPQNPDADFDPFSRELDPGDKAEGAEDYEDIGDDDLASDEEAEGKGSVFEGDAQDDTLRRSGDFMLDEGLSGLANLNAPQEEEFDDLFGDDDSSPVFSNEATSQEQSTSNVKAEDFDFGSEDHQSQPSNFHHSGTILSQDPLGAIDPSDLRPFTAAAEDGPLSREQQLQQELFAMSRSGFGNSEVPPAPAENHEELLASLWPKFKSDTIPKFMDLLPPKKARYVGKAMLKRPKPVNPTKVNLDLAQDQEKNFRISSVLNKRTSDDVEKSGLIVVRHGVAANESNDEDVDMGSDYEREPLGDISWQDLQILCEDWDTRSASPFRSDELISHDVTGGRNNGYDDLDPKNVEWPPAKRRRLYDSHADILRTPQFSFPSLQDPQQATAKIAKQIILDFNDSRLLIDHIHPATLMQKGLQTSDRKDVNGKLSTTLSQRYNISNDEAYDLLKENHQSKVRSTLGNPNVEHSLPAVRLQWPFYKTKLEKQEARSFHRPPLSINRNAQVVFGKPNVIKRKYLKGRDMQSIFARTKDLSLNDNSNVLLLEYSEEYPTMLSNLGMSNRIINYYRRKTMEDSSRPKLDIGETAVLLPQDKSPFSIFGHVDPGDITPALYNVVRSTTGLDGSTWFLRNIENLYVVGQEFPSVDVPGPHSRKVTTASKNRLKMISYRLIRRAKSHRIGVNDITSHFIDTTDMQNRQKMKEFMTFDKDYKEWKMRPGEAVPEEEVVRTMVKPEDVCLLESMQVGQQHLQDAGFSKDDDESEDDDAKEGQNIEQQLAPWYTTRNFLHATQGKAMLQLHGEGDPSGRGEALSFIRTSMKGGFKAVGESVAEKLDAKKTKELGGHSYNVARQQQSYEDAVRRIWDAQKRSLSLTLDQSDSGTDEQEEEEGVGVSDNQASAPTPRSELRKSTMHSRDDDVTSQSTRLSSNSQIGKILIIARKVRDKYGNFEEVKDVIRNPRVIRQYLKRRHAKESENILLSDLQPTGDPEADKRREKMLQKELARLERNKERRVAREKQKGIHTDGAGDAPDSPNSPAAATGKTGGTQRKCANCGQVGHIKTNKKLCPMLNGTIKPDEGFGNSAFTGTPTL